MEETGQNRRKWKKRNKMDAILEDGRSLKKCLKLRKINYVKEFKDT